MVGPGSLVGGCPLESGVISGVLYTVDALISAYEAGLYKGSFDTEGFDLVSHTLNQAFYCIPGRAIGYMEYHALVSIPQHPPCQQELQLLRSRPEHAKGY